MKKYLTMTGELILLLGTFLMVATIHNDYIVPNSGAYGNFMFNNLPIWISVMFAVTSVLVLVIFQIRRLVLKDRYESIAAMSRFTRLRKEDVLLTSLMGIFTGLLFICMIKVSFIANHFPDFNEYIDMFMRSQSFIMIIIGLCIIGPLFEEIFFRGILFNLMLKKMPFIAALLLQAVIYGYCQPNPSIQVIAVFLAIIYGILYYRLQSIWSTIITAAVMNTIIFVSKKTGLLDALSSIPDHVLLLITGICLLFIIVLLKAVWHEDTKINNLKMIGNLFLWTSVYSLVYYPFIFGVWNNGVMRISAINQWLGHNNIFGFLPYDILALVVYYFVMKKVHKQNLIKVSNFTRISVKNGVLIAIMGTMMGVWVQCLFLFPYFSQNFPQFEQLTVYLTTAILPVYIAFLVYHSIYKEIFFRALVYNVLRSALPMWISVLMTGIIYGGLFFNWDPLLTVYACLGALIFSLLFEWYKSIWAPIINEFFVFAAYYVVRKLELAYGRGIVWTFTICTIGVLCFMIYLWKNRDTERKQPVAVEQVKVSA
ncbi:CPBP family intramembrane metalloprotease [Paenibacillus sp. PR3]|uniref:CPBP family intramembrane metalloprotease n=1 Tax=Paenibacillus terricola TaxID=2763503 RepID=A0ABR8MT43_9BACL|nr:type II CAAX endopeptidase family protein [Paenibacillus terricola]MBD3919134.1 CPBP family intramembrane metalloprotease [Paenibacillus terricola]